MQTQGQYFDPKSGKPVYFDPKTGTQLTDTPTVTSTPDAPAKPARMSGAGPASGITPNAGRTVTTSSTTRKPEILTPIGPIERGWDYLNKGLISPEQIEFANTALASNPVPGSGILSIPQARKGISDMESGLTSPLSLGTMAVGGLETQAGKLGFEGLEQGANLVSRGLAGMYGVKGAMDMTAPDSTPGQRVMGGLNTILGSLGVSRSLPSFGKSTPAGEDIFSGMERRNTPRTLVGEGVTPPSDWSAVVDKSSEVLGQDVSHLSPQEILRRLVLIDPKVDQEAGYLANTVGRMIRSGEAMPSPSLSPSLANSAADELSNSRRVGIHKPDVDNALLEDTARAGMLDENGNPITKPQQPNIPMTRQVGPPSGPPPNNPPPTNPGSGGGAPNIPSNPAVNNTPIIPPPPPQGWISKLAKTNWFREANAALKTSSSTLDLSMFRQNSGFMTHPEYYKNIVTAVKAMGSDAALTAIKQGIEAKPSGLFAKTVLKAGGRLVSQFEDAGLDLSNHSVNERFVSRWLTAGKYNPLGASKRAFEGYTLKMRADIADKLYAEAASKGFGGFDSMKKIADVVNRGTGTTRFPGDLERSATAMRAANDIFFAPRYNYSRVQMYTKAFSALGESNPIARREAVRSLLGTITTGFLLGQLSKAMGADVSLNPTSSDFLKIRLGNTRLDPFNGLQQYPVKLIQLVLGESTSTQTNRTTDLRNPKYGQQSGTDTLWNFIQDKASPAVGMGLDAIRGSLRSGDDYTFTGSLGSHSMPFVMQDLWDIYKENPNEVPAFMIPAIIGWGVQTYKR